MPDEVIGTAWETEESSGGLLDDFDFTIERAEFSTDTRYRNGEVLLLKFFGTGTTADGAFPETELFYSCGEGWASFDGGRTAQHEGGKVSFKKNTNIGRLIDRMVELGMAQVLVSHGQPTEAAAYEGLRIHVKRETLTFPGRGDREAVSFEIALPTAYLGEGSAAPAPAPAAAAATPASNGGAASGAVLKAKVMAEAKKHGDHAAFLDAVLTQYPEVAEDEALFALVVDEAGLFASANA